MKLERNEVWGPVFNKFAMGFVRQLNEMLLSMPAPAARRVGEVLGGLAASILKKKLRPAVEQVERALGPGHEGIAAESLINFGQLPPEVSKIESIFDRTRFRRYIDVHGEHHLRTALAAGKGVVAVSAHCGNWEVAAAVLAHLGPRVSWLLRPVENPFIQARLNEIRATAGVGVIEKWGGLREAMHVLRRGEVLAMLVDQDARDQGVFVPFFGRDASTLKSPALLSLRTGAPILPFVCRRMKDGRLRVDIAEPFVEKETDDADKDMERATARFTAQIEAWIRETPEQWLWVHRRWKTQRTPAASP